VVDDSPTVREIVAKGLSEVGFTVVTAENGKKGLMVLKHRLPALILSDIDMPVMDGMDFCQAVHADSMTAGIPFVVMSRPSVTKGDAIPLWPRMIAIGDTFHALTSDRPYRKGMDCDQALQIIDYVKGTQLCPECVAIFQQLMET